MPVVEESPTLAGTLPGPELAGELAGIPLGRLDDYGLVEVMRAARRLTAWAESLELAAVGELDRRRSVQADRYGAWTVEMSRALCDEISAALTLSGTAAANRLSLAIALDRLLPGTRQALVEGRIDVGKARVICDGIIGISGELALRVEALVLPDAPRLTARQLAARVRKAIVEADPEGFEERRKTAEKGRRLELYGNPDGTMDLAARDLPAEDADAAYNYISALAAALKTDGDERPIDAIRADVALALLRGHHPAEVFPAHTGQSASAPDDAAGPIAPDNAERPIAPDNAERPIAPDSTAGPAVPGNAAAPAAPGEPTGDGRRPTRTPFGTSGDTTATGSATGSDSRDTADTPDVGRQEATEITQAVRGQLSELLNQVRELNRPDEHRLLITEAARRITDALAPLKIRWCHIAADTDGEVVHGHDGYRPPAAMRRLVQARNSTCAFPTCRRRATKCDLDHTVPFHRGGPTCPCNIAPLCRGHHLLKQHPDWTLIQLWPGVLLWIAPTGHWYLADPDP